MAFSLLAYAITRDLNGKNGYEGWRCMSCFFCASASLTLTVDIFLLEGGATSIMALLTFWLVPRSPSTAWWLSPAQRAALLAGLEADNSAYVEYADEKHQKLSDGLFVLASSACGL